MLLFVDMPKAIKVMRLEETEEGVRRNRIGSVQKGKFDLNSELGKELTPDEVTDVTNVIAFYQNAGDVQRQLDIYRFPEIVRNVVEHVISDQASDIEKRLVVAALTDAVRKIRKGEREAVGT